MSADVLRLVGQVYTLVRLDMTISNKGVFMKTFKNKTIIVTGAASGIGRATALAFADEGANVIVADVQEREAIETVKMIDDRGGVGLFVGCDVSKEADVKNMVERTLEKFGRLDGAFNNAGTEGTPAPITECTMENWDKTVNTDLKGVWLSMKHEIPALLKSGGGAIVNCSSIAGLVGFATIPAYVASKHGVIGLTETAALEYAKEGIRVNAVCPGAIHTPMLERFTQGNDEAMAKMDPMGRIGEPEEIAQTVLFLMSPKASYITGQSLAVDGGWVSQ